MRRAVLIIVGLILFVCAATPAHGQQLSGRIDGTVTDPQGRSVPGVMITAVHTATGAEYTTRTGAYGQFTIANVRLGVFDLTAEIEGFKRTTVEGVDVEVGGSAGVVIQMELGAVREEITVSGDVAQVLVNTVDAEMGTVVDDRRVLELPLNGRNAVELTLQQAGVYFERSPDGQGDKLFINGQRHQGIQMTLDGVDIQDNLNKSSATMIDQPLIEIASENVEEFRVVTGLASAEYAGGGAHVTAVTRSGTNEFHGSVFWFNRNDAFSANDFFNNSANPAVETPPLNRNQFGGRLGGPIIRDKLFFYLGYQQTRESRGNSVNRLVYTAEARDGMFRYLDGVRTTPEAVAQNPGLVRAVDLLSCGAGVATALGRDCFDSRFDLADPAQVDPFMGGTVFATMPLPNNLDLGDGLNTGGFRFNARSKTVGHLPSARLDYQINTRNSIYGSVNYNDRDIDGDFINGREPIYPAIGPLGSRVTHATGYSLNWTATIGSSIVNEARGTAVIGENAFLVTQPFGTPFTLDINTISDPYAPFNGSDIRDNRTVSFRDVLGWSKGSHQLRFGFEFRERFMKNVSEDGVRSLIEFNMDDNDAPPGFGTTDLEAIGGGDINSADSETARDLSNNLVGAIEDVVARFNVTSLTSGFVPDALEQRIWRNYEYSWFVNDVWRVRPGLTLNLGVRWELYTVPNETQGLALNPEGGLLAAYGVSGPGGFFNPGTFDGTSCPQLGRLPIEPTTANAAALITGCTVPFLPATGTNGRPLYKNDYDNFAPVAGIAWDPFGDGKTSIRAGFRISYYQDAFSAFETNLDDNEGLQVVNFCNPVDGNCLNNPHYLREITAAGSPRPSTPEFELPSRRSILDSSVNDFRTVDLGIGTPHYNEWNVSIAREFANQWAIEARYVGNRGVGLRRVADFNEINVNARDPVTGETFVGAFVKAQQNLACNRSSGFGNRFDDATGAACVVPNPLMGDLIAGDAASLRSRTGLVTALEENRTGEFVYRLTQAETSRPSPGQGSIRGGSFWGRVLEGRFPLNLFQANPLVASSRALIGDGWSTYHALQLELRRRFSQGFSFQGNYTFQKALAPYDGDSNSLLDDSRPSSVRNPDYSTQEYMPRHTVNANWVYELPLGPQKRYLNRGGLPGRILGGWQLTGLTSFRGGRPLGIYSGVGTFHADAISGRNTVNLANGFTAGDIRELSGRAAIGAGVFWLDPCLSGFNGVDCTLPGGTKGIFTLPEPGQLGALGQTVLFGPARFIIDAGLMKRTRIRETVDLEFRWEIFNVLNRANFDVPDTNITSPGFGQVTRTVTEPRLMQFALKVNF